MPTDLSSVNFSISSLIAGFLFGVIGYWMFKDGRKRNDYYFLGIGIVLMIYPYFTSGPKADWGIGILLCIVAYAIRSEN